MTFPHLARDELSFPAPPDCTTVDATLQSPIVKEQSFRVEGLMLQLRCMLC